MNSLKQPTNSLDHEVIETKRGHNKTITDEHRLTICRLLGEFKRSQEVIAFMRDQYHIELSPTSIRYYLESRVWRGRIEQFRTDFLKTVMDVPSANKKVRLQKLDDLLYHLETNDRRFRLNDRERVDRILRTIEALRAEMAPAGDTNLYVTQINSLTDEEIEERKSELIDKIMRIQKLKKEETNASRIGETAPFDGDSGAPPKQTLQEE